MDSEIAYKMKEALVPRKLSLRKFRKITDRGDSHTLSTGEVILLISSVWVSTVNYYIAIYRPDSRFRFSIMRREASILVDDIQEATRIFRNMCREDWQPSQD